MRTCEIAQSADRNAAGLSERSQADGWYGVADAKERRRRQNFLNQRAHRFRKRLGRGFIVANGQWHRVEPLPRTLHITTPPLSESTHQTQRSLPDRIQRLETILGVASIPDLHSSGRLDSSTRTNAALSEFMASWPAEVRTLWVQSPDANKRAIMLTQVARFLDSIQLNCPSADHLLSLTRINVHRAFVSNMVTLGITWEWMQDDSISPFSMQRPGVDLAVLPEKLRPTELQRSSIYHTWINLFPCPVMRNNLIRAGNEWDDEELCGDIMGFWEGTSTGPFGLVVWGEPADPSNWELTEGFVKKWGWVMQGCVDLMKSTNYWRAKRGERLLFPSNVVYS